MAVIEQHPLKPFTPRHARLLMLGSFPPARKRWSMDFFYQKGVALFDTASAVVRTTGTAADKDLEVVTPTDLDALLRKIPDCRAVVVTGQKAADVFTSHFQIAQPKVGAYTEFLFE